MSARSTMRAKIRADKIISRLMGHIESTRRDEKGNPVGTMDSSAVTAALGLLRKILPDLTAVEHSGHVATKPASEMTDDELAAIAARGSEAPPGEEAPAKSDPSKLH
ncbi:MAG: hypothetical protein WAK55_11675 [Xanthobacteraceae bacterium]